MTAIDLDPAQRELGLRIFELLYSVPAVDDVYL